MSKLAAWNSPSSPIGGLGMGLATGTTGRAAESRRRAFEFLPRPPRLNLPCAGAILATGSGRTYIADMVKIAISQEAFDAIAVVLPVESVGFLQTNKRGERLVWLPSGVVAKLKAMRGRGESYSNVILRLAAEAAAAR
jgi:hypothetical protein